MTKVAIGILILLSSCVRTETCIDLKTRYYLEDGTYSHSIEEMWCE